MDVNFLKHNSAVSTETRISCVVEGAGVGVCVYGNSPSGGFVTDSGTHLDSLKDKHCV